MKPSKLLIAAAAVALTAGCNGESGTGGSDAPTGPAQTVAPPQGKTWDQVVTITDEGGYLMGNPDAPVKLVEFASMTCPHCADFSEDVDELVNDYVKTGQVSYELRNYVRDGLDMAMSLIARCGEPGRFFALSDALFDSQRDLFEQAQSAPQGQQPQTPQDYAQLAGLQQWAAQRGLPTARTNACLTNQSEIDRLVQMNTDAAQFNIPGTPSFLINGELVENASAWEQLEPRLREAVSG
jgi:protein-disulfide isomerase